MKAILTLILASVSMAASSQLKGFSIGPYVERAIPTGNFENLYNNGWGAGAGADIKLPGKLGLTGSVGIVRFGGKAIQHAQGQQKLSALTGIPIRVGLKYRLPLVYIKMETGSARLNDEKGNGFILSPGIGLRILGLDVQAKYETWIRNESYSFYGLKASYNF